MLKFTLKRLAYFKHAMLVIALLIPLAALADDIPPTDNGGANGQSTGAQNVPAGYSGAGSGADGSSGSDGSNTDNNSALTKIGGSGLCNEDLINKSTEELKIFSVGVKCFENITAGLAETTIQSFSADMGRIVYIVLILYVIFFGLKVATGISAGGRLKGESFAGAMKIAFVAYLVYGLTDGGFNVGFGSSTFSANISALSGLNIGSQPGLIQIYALVISGYHSLLTIVMPQNGFGDCSSGAGGITFSGQGTDAVWQSMDCMFSKFIGWNAKNGYGTGNGATDKGGIALLFGYIASKTLPGNGFFIGGLLFNTLMMLMLGFFRLAFVYILSMIAMILLFSIGPLMIPMMLFKRTESYFEGWYKLIIGMILQPVILFAFFSFISGLLVDTIKKMEDLFAQMKPSLETSQVTRTGDKQDVDVAYVINSVSGAIDKLDKEALLNGVIILVIAYLLTSFINYVGKIAAELAGVPELDLQNFAPKFAGGG